MDKWVIKDVNRNAGKRKFDEGSPGLESIGFKSNQENIQTSLEHQASCASKQTKVSDISEHEGREFCNDIGKVIGNSISDFDKYELLTNHWVPPSIYSYPFSEHNKKGKIEKRYANKKFLDMYEWLVLSDSKKGFFCKYCPLFTTGLTGGYKNNVQLQKLVSQPLTNFSKLLGKDGYLNAHSNNQYHKASVQFGKDFVSTFKNPEKEISNQFVSLRLKLIQENRKRLVPIVESIIFLGRQNIPFREHRDDGQISFNDTHNNDGNFRALLRFRVKSGDKDLEAHLKNASSRATYISKTTQNSLINACAEEISSSIINKIKEAGIYSIMFDETTDASHQSQLTLVVRYVFEGNIREDFIQFLNPRDSDNFSQANKRDVCESNDAMVIEEPTVTGIDVARNVISILKSHDLNIENCVGVSTDGCTVMTSETRGAVSEIQKHAPNAVYSPCHNHALNLSISKASSVQAIRNSVGTIKEIISFFKASSKRHKVLRHVLGHTLASLCETRWIERHESVIEFKSSLSKICEALDLISKWKDAASASKAKALLTALCDSEFVISINCLSDVLSVTLPLSRQYQKDTIDIKSAQEILLNTLSVLEDKRSKCEEVFWLIFEDAKKDAAYIGTEIAIPRISYRQNNRPNYNFKTPLDYYRVSLFIPMLENIVEDLKSRFSEETLQLHNLAIFLPQSSTSTEFQEEEISALEVICGRYFKLAGYKTSSLMLQHLKGELLCWRAKWIRAKDSKHVVPKLALDSFLICDRDIFPTIHILLKILASLPVSVASAERSFSTLRRLKTWLRSTMSEDRLTGLALLNIHSDSDINVDVENVITRFSKTGSHRLEFIL